MATDDPTPLPDADPVVLRRFLAKIRILENGCWVWIGGKARGYGHENLGRRDGRKLGIQAHRLSWKLFRGPVDPLIQVCHDCPNVDHGDPASVLAERACVAPNHLFLGTRKENMQDCMKKGRFPTGERNGAKTKPWKTPRGEAHAMARFTDDQIREIRSAPGLQREVAARFGTRQGTVSQIRSRTIWAHVK